MVGLSLRVRGESGLDSQLEEGDVGGLVALLLVLMGTGRVYVLWGDALNCDWGDNGERGGLCGGWGTGGEGRFCMLLWDKLFR